MNVSFPDGSLRAWSHPDIEKVGEGVHVFDAIRVLVPQLVEEQQGLIDV